MDINPKETPQRTVRFSENVELGNQDVEKNSATENAFRVPQLPIHGLKKKRPQQKSPLKTVNINGTSQLQISPGTSATDQKQAAMLERLERRRNQNLSKWEEQKQQQSVPAMDLGETEKSFLDQSFIPPPRPSFSNMSMIQSTDTFIERKVSKKNNGLACSTPRRPMRSKESQKDNVVPHIATPRPNNSVQVLFENQPIYESHEDIAERQFKAICEWCNALLNTCNHFDDGIVDLGKTKEDATQKLQELLSRKTKDSVKAEQPKFSYKEFLRKQEFDIMRKKAFQVYTANEMPQRIVNMVQMGVIGIRDGSNVYSDLILKTTLLRVFLSFHPVWLHLGMETVFDKAINIPDGSSFLSVMTRFINTYLFSDPDILKMKKYAIGTVKRLATPEGRVALHRHFLTKSCQFFYCVEMCKMQGIIPSDPSLFVRKGQFKSLGDVFSEISREVLSATGTPLTKAFQKLGFAPKYKQDYFDDLEYKINSIADLNDGVNLGKLVEVACNLGRRAVMSKLRNPGGDRLRKIGNVSVVLDIATKASVDVGQIRPEAIVAGNMEAILEVMWKIIGVFVLSSNDQAQQLRKETKRRSLLNNSGQESPDHEVDQAKTFEQFIMDICQSLGISYGITISCFDDLKDGILLSIIWRDYNKKATDIHFYEGKDLFRKVVSAATSELDIPSGLHFSLPLFVHQFLSRVFEISRLNEAATRIQKAYRSHKFFKTLRAYLKSNAYLAIKKNRAAEVRDKPADEPEVFENDDVFIVESCQRGQPAEKIAQLVSYDVSTPSSGCTESAVNTPNLSATVSSSVSFDNQTYAVNHDSVLSEYDNVPTGQLSEQDDEQDVHNATASTYLERSTQSINLDNQTYAIHSDTVMSEKGDASDGQTTPVPNEDQEGQNVTASTYVEMPPMSILLDDRTYTANNDSIASEKSCPSNNQTTPTPSEDQEQNTTASTYLEMSTQSVLLDDQTYAGNPESTMPDNDGYTEMRTPTGQREQQGSQDTTASSSLERSAMSTHPDNQTYVIDPEALQVDQTLRSEGPVGGDKVVEAALFDSEEERHQNLLTIMKQCEEDNAVVIQRHWKGYCARKRYNKMKSELVPNITNIQKLARGALARNKLREYLDKSKREKMVVKLQSHVRQFLARRKYHKLVEEQEGVDRKIVLVQSCVRRFLAKKTYSKLLEKKADYEKLIVSFQSHVRCYLAKKKLHELRKKAFERKVIIVQAAVRRHLAAKQAKELKFQILREQVEEELAQRPPQRQEEESADTVEYLLSGMEEDKINEEAVLLEDTLNDLAAMTIQRFFRNIVNMKRFMTEAQELARKREYERKVVIVQSVVRRFLAIKELQRLRETAKQFEFAMEEYIQPEQPVVKEENAEEQKVVVVQRVVRGFLARRKINRLVQENIVKLEETLHQTSVISPLKTPPTYVDKVKPRLLLDTTPSTPELLRTLRRLRREIMEVKAHNAACEQAISNLKYRSAIAEVEQEEETLAPAPKRREPTAEEQRTAAITIQKFWRGHRIRADHKEHIVKRRSAMQIYREDIEKIDASFDAKSSAYKRLEESTEMLFHTSMYKQKVAAVTIERIIKLSSHLCNFFVLNCDGLSAVLDRMEQGDRSPGESEIISYLSLALDRIIAMTLSQPAIQKNVVKYTQDILKILFHKFNAFHNNVKIVVPSVSGLVGLKKIDESISFEKAKYYISQADKRYNRLRHGDPLKMAVEDLKKWYS